MIMHRADAKTIHAEVRDVLKDALLTYPGDPLHVTVYVLDRCEGRNNLQTVLSRTDDLTSHPDRLAAIIEAVENYLDDCLRSYLDIA